jgi:hypothetical protein
MLRQTENKKTRRRENKKTKLNSKKMKKIIFRMTEARSKYRGSGAGEKQKARM